MKNALLSIGLVGLAASFGWQAQAIGGRAAPLATATTDDPPPDIRDCPFCGGNPSLHKARFFALESEIARVTLRLVP